MRFLTRLKALLAAATLALGVAAVAVVAAPPAAHAALYTVECFPIYDQHGHVIDVICVRVPLAVDRRPCCLDYWIDFHEELVNPADQRRYLTDLATGLDLLIQGRRDAAGLAFLSSARALRGSAVRFRDGGPSPDPWLVAAGTNLADGLTLMQRVAGDPSPDPWFGAAMVEFDQALAGLSQQRVFG
jgi:hypothetical protein